MTRDRLLHYRVLDGTCNAEQFSRFIDEMSISVQRHNIVDASIVMDNVRFHKSREVIDMMAHHNFPSKISSSL
jgi:hypothetical protein